MKPASAAYRAWRLQELGAVPDDLPSPIRHGPSTSTMMESPQPLQPAPPPRQHHVRVAGDDDGGGYPSGEAHFSGEDGGAEGTMSGYGGGGSVNGDGVDGGGVGVGGGGVDGVGGGDGVVAGLGRRLKPDASLPVPRGFTKSIERLRSGLQAKAEMQRMEQHLMRGSVDPRVRVVRLTAVFVCDLWRCVRAVSLC